MSGRCFLLVDSFGECLAQLEDVVIEDLAEVVSPVGTRQVTARLLEASSIPVTLTSVTDVVIFDASFVIEICADFREWLRRAAGVVRAEAGPETWMAWQPELTFIGEQRWRVRFARAPGAGGAVVDFNGAQMRAVGPVQVPSLNAAPERPALGNPAALRRAVPSDSFELACQSCSDLHCH